MFSYSLDQAEQYLFTCHNSCITLSSVLSDFALFFLYFLSFNFAVSHRISKIKIKIIKYPRGAGNPFIISITTDLLFDDVKEKCTNWFGEKNNPNFEWVRPLPVTKLLLANNRWLITVLQIYIIMESVWVCTCVCMCMCMCVIYFCVKLCCYIGWNPSEEICSHSLSYELSRYQNISNLK